MILYGNSSIYDLQFTYSLGATSYTQNTTITQGSNADTLIAVNRTGVGRSFTQTYTFSSAPPPGTYNISMTVNTSNAGGSGVGSTLAAPATTTVSIGASDNMGPASILLKSGVTPSFSNGPYVVISGFNYYTANTVITFLVNNFILNNIYNVLLDSSITIPFNYITLSSGSTLTTNSTNNLRYTINGGASYTEPFPTSSVGNREYSNHSPITHTLSGNNVAPGFHVRSQLRNALNVYTPSSSGFNRLYPPSQSIGYISGWNTSTETTIPKNQGGTTILAIASHTRMSVPGSETNPLQPVNLSNFSNTGMTIYDPAYNPFDGILYASGFTSSLSNYITPTSQTFTFNNATRKYLVINAVLTNFVKIFTLEFQCSDILADIDVYIKWVGSGWGQQIWYNAKILSTNAGVGAADASSTKTGNIVTVPIKININDDTISPASIGNIYIIIGFGGNITTNKILIRNT